MKISKSFPIPPDIKRGVYAPVIRQMSVGDSILLPDGVCYRVAHEAARRHGLRVRCRQDKDGRIRVWRVS